MKIIVGNDHGGYLLKKEIAIYSWRGFNTHMRLLRDEQSIKQWEPFSF
jgi:ribose 5-phosphate isomerase RpiB